MALNSTVRGILEYEKIWNRIIHSGKLGVIEFIISLLALISSMFLLILDFNGVVSLTQENLVCIAIILLGILVASSLIERYGVLSSIFENLVSPDESHAYLSVRSQYDRLHPVDDYYSDITEMCVMAIANTSFLRGNGIMNLVQAARKGITVKLLSIDPNSELANFYETSKILSQVSIKYYNESL